MQNHEAQGNVDNFHLPEWETTARHRGEKHAHTGQKASVRERAFIIFDRLMPGHRKYFGFTRNITCIAILLVVLLLLALILGLAIGLSRKPRYTSAPSLNLENLLPKSYPATINISLWAPRLTQVI